jgi:hypothetical protein
MGRYRKIDVRIWNDAGFGSLSDDAKLAFLFCLTHPHLTSLGAMRATVAGLAAELGWEAERFSEAFGELVRVNADERALVEYDAECAFVGLPNFLKYNAPENPNVVKSWGSLLDLLPECDAKSNLLQRVDACLAEMGEGFVVAWEGVSQRVCGTLSKGLPEGYAKPSRKGSNKAKVNSGKGMPNPEPEPEQEPEPKPEQEPEPDKKDAADASGDSSTSVKRKSKSQEPIAIPHELDTPEARKALDEFKEHRRQKRKPLTPLSESKLLTEWASKGAGRFVAAVDHSIANGWQGLFEPNTKTNQPQTDMHSGIQAWLAEESETDGAAVPVGIDPDSILEVRP